MYYRTFAEDVKIFYHLGGNLPDGKGASSFLNAPFKYA